MANTSRQAARNSSKYSAHDIEVLEGLEPVRRRPGMYIGGTDENALHHLTAEVLDNAMDEAVAGHASWIDVELHADGSVTVADNGRGIPIEPHPKFKSKSALEVVLTTLHAGGKFNDSIYKTAGGLHGVGISVVNALSDKLIVEVARDQELWVQAYVRGKPKGPLKCKGKVRNRRGTMITFHPDPEIFGKSAGFSSERLYHLARSKAYLFRGVEIRWKCASQILSDASEVPDKETLHFPGGLSDFLDASLGEQKLVTAKVFAGEAPLNANAGRIEWAIAWPEGGGSLSSYCNTVPTSQGGTHEAGLRTALSRGLKAYGNLVGNRKASSIIADDIMAETCGLLSIFISNPEFQGQTKERLSTSGVSRLIENSLKDHFEHFLAGDPESANALLMQVIERMEDRLRRREARALSRKSATRKLNLPGKLIDCTHGDADSTELFLVEGDSAGGSAKQARIRDTQAVLPLRGKILNVASATAEKLRGNQELADLSQALGCGTGGDYKEHMLRYERVIIMTDADVDGAHIASLLMTYFFHEMLDLIVNGHLYLAIPPLYRLSQGGNIVYARDDAHKAIIEREQFKTRAKIEISRFKGLGEMPPAQLRETTMDPMTRNLFRVVVPNEEQEEGSNLKPLKHKSTADLVERLMGRKPEHRLAFIQENAAHLDQLDV